jgi:hypothetical protein
MFGKWDRRFLFLSIDTMQMYYGKKPTSKAKSACPIEVSTKQFL